MKNIQQISIVRAKAFSLARTIAEQLRTGRSLSDDYDKTMFTVSIQQTPLLSSLIPSTHEDSYFLQSIMITWSVQKNHYSLSLPTITREQKNVHTT